MLAAQQQLYLIKNHLFFEIQTAQVDSAHRNYAMIKEARWWLSSEANYKKWYYIERLQWNKTPRGRDSVRAPSLPQRAIFPN